MNLKNIINAVKVTIILFVASHSTVLFNHLVNKNNWTNSIEIEKYLK